MTFYVGQKVRFIDIVDPGDDTTIMVILELRGDRVLVGYVVPDFADWAIKPTAVHEVLSLESVHCPDCGRELPRDTRCNCAEGYLP